MQHLQPHAVQSAFFKDRVALVTGGASGIGYAVAGKLVGLGAKVAIWDIQKERLDECQERYGDRVLTRSVNVSDKAAVSKAMDELTTAWRGIDHLLNNAGIIGQRMTVQDFDGDELDRVLAVNLKSMFYVSSAFIRASGAESGRSIVNLSSIAARTGGMVGNIAYATTKGAAASFTYALAKELAPHVRVNALAPGVINTEIQKDVFADPANIEAMANLIPLKRLGTAEEVADAAVWLLSDAAAYITGVVLDVSGGR
ncbi:SDR family NAD(P)-dependent oxidoreductase [Mesorhizobium sp. DCY119]|uniref:SDR family NAD(P)-dependent oxidoreductase n=1 Tax=Mesorhizobium sp. DCY119 TaxID=2108445 RepID=UPI000E733359|nr:SDR family NAD(P)-dependent oxidoreductase [Mesorhizobium sp. DCY119]RJG41219.1 SDR family oxidoreductase [Mesorhizobium sp. DCY119]